VKGEQVFHCIIWETEMLDQNWGCLTFLAFLVSWMVEQNEDSICTYLHSFVKQQMIKLVKGNTVTLGI